MSVLPKTVGRYELRRELGRGAMGVVYEALDPALGRTIALKTINIAFAISHEERQTFENRFLVEARIAARLSHPGIVVIHDVGQDPQTGTLFMALEYLEGRTVAELIKDEVSLDWREALRIARGVAEALHHAHSQGVVHRDVKPANIMLLRNGEPKIMDFGIAKLETARVKLTAMGQFFGTPLYMSPEQALGRPVDGRGDLFSLGAITYTLLTRQQAFGAKSIPAIITRVMQEDPPAPSQLVPGLPADVDYVVARALAKSPEARYPSGLVLAEDLEDVLTARPPRHRAGWTAEALGEGTMVSAPARSGPGSAGTGVAREHMEAARARGGRPGADPGTPGGSVPARSAAAPARPAGRPVPSQRPIQKLAFRALALLAAGALGAVLVTAWKRQRAPVPVAEPSPAAALPPLASAPPPLASEPPAETPSESLPRAAEPPAAEGSPRAADAPAPEPGPRSARTPVPPAQAEHAAEASAAAVSPTETAYLAIDFEHHLKSGTLRVWVDRVAVLEEQLDAAIARKIITFQLRKGRIAEVLELAPGGHDLRVQVSWDDNQRTESIWGNFEPGRTRRLEIRVGRLRRNLSLDWR